MQASKGGTILHTVTATGVPQVRSNTWETHELTCRVYAGESDSVTFMQTLGATLFPAVMEELIGVGRYIIDDVAGPDPPSPPPITIASLSGPSDYRLSPYTSASNDTGVGVFRAMATEYPTLLHAQQVLYQFLFGRDIIVVDAAAQREGRVWLPPGGWMEMNCNRARMTWSGGLHKECPPDTLAYPNASRHFTYCQHGQYTAWSPPLNFTGQHQCGKSRSCATQMYVREGAVIPTTLPSSMLALKVYPGLCPGIAWRATQFGGPRVKNCQNASAIGGGSKCPQYGRFPCESIIVNGEKCAINATQVRAYDDSSETMALSVALKRLRGECQTYGRPVLHFMHTSLPAVRNVSLERQPPGDPWKGLQDIPLLSDAPQNGTGSISGGWWLAREGPWHVIAVAPPLTLKELSGRVGAARVTVRMW